jgi:hypothetical protein
MVQKIITRTTIAEQQSDFEFWKSRSVEERLKTVEEIRSKFHGWKDHAQPRLQRVYTIVKRA